MSQQFNIDTVEHAAAQPDVEQPWAELGLKEDEYPGGSRSAKLSSMTSK